MWRGRIAALMSAIVAAGVSGESASATNKPPKPESSAVSQYVEMLPTGSGSVAAGTKSSAAAVLPPKARRALRSLGDPAAAALAAVATSSAYAAPPRTIKPQPGRGRPQQQPKPSVPSALSSVAETAGVQDGGRVVTLFILIFLATSALLTVRALRPRATSR